MMVISVSVARAAALTHTHVRIDEKKKTPNHVPETFDDSIFQYGCLWPRRSPGVPRHFGIIRNNYPPRVFLMSTRLLDRMRERMYGTVGCPIFAFDDPVHAVAGMDLLS